MEKITIAKNSLLIGLFAISGYTVDAQQPEKDEIESRKLKIDIQIDENGEKKRITKEIPLGDLQDIGEILQSLDELKDMEINTDDGDVEIIIKKGDKAGEEDFSFNFNFPGVDGMPDFGSHFGHSANKAKLGAVLKNIGDEEAQELGTKEGAVLLEVIENSAASEAGLKKGDVVTKIDGIDIKAPSDIMDALAEKKAGDKIDIQYLRDKKQEKTTVTLKENEHSGPHMMWMTPDGKEQYFNFEEFRNEFKNSEDWEKFQNDMDKLREDLKEIHPQIGALKGELHDAKNRAFLGITPGDSEEGEKGVTIGSVIHNSAAEKMGLKPGDVIYELNNKTIDNFDNLVSVLKEAKPGDEIKVEFKREGKKMKESGTLKSMAETMPIPDIKVDHFLKDLPHVQKYDVRIVIAEVEEDEAKAVREQTGVAELKSLKPDRISFASNPNNGVFKLNFSLQEKGATYLRMFDNAGRQVYYEELDNFSGNYENEIDISSEPNGFYILSIVQNGKQFTKKIVKQ